MSLNNSTLFFKKSNNRIFHKHTKASPLPRKSDSDEPQIDPSTRHRTKFGTVRCTSLRLKSDDQASRKVSQKILVREGLGAKFREASPADRGRQNGVAASSRSVSKEASNVVHKCTPVRRVLCKPLEIVGSRVAASFSTRRYRSGPAQPSNPPPPPPPLHRLSCYRTLRNFGMHRNIESSRGTRSLSKFHSNAEDLLPNEGFRFFCFFVFLVAEGHLQREEHRGGGDERVEYIGDGGSLRMNFSDNRRQKLINFQDINEDFFVMKTSQKGVVLKLCKAFGGGGGVANFLRFLTKGRGLLGSPLGNIF